VLYITETCKLRALAAAEQQQKYIKLTYAKIMVKLLRLLI